jgi:3-hydroxy-9,10-secoandrosta-1,3,5(10)-triene-9,17-dione monooxygenase
MATRAACSLVEANPLRETLIARAHALLPAIAARAEEADARRDLPSDTVAEICAAGLFRSFQPRSWGGLELDPRDVLDIQNIFAEVCVSTAWIYGILSVQAFLLARFDQQAQADVWGKNPLALVSSSFQPVAKVSPVEGGFRIAGRFSFSSGQQPLRLGAGRRHRAARAGPGEGGDAAVPRVHCFTGRSLPARCARWPCWWMR